MLNLSIVISLRSQLQNIIIKSLRQEENLESTRTWSCNAKWNKITFFVAINLSFINKPDILKNLLLGPLFLWKFTMLTICNWNLINKSDFSLLKEVKLHIQQVNEENWFSFTMDLTSTKRDHLRMEKLFNGIAVRRKL